MLKVNFVTSPLSSGHAVRGVGFYTQRLLSVLKSPSNEKKITIVNSGENYDLTHYPFFDLFWHTLPIFTPKPVIVTVHDVIPLEYPEIYKVGVRGRINIMLQKIALWRAKRIITDSQASKTAITNYLDVNPNKIDVIYLAADKKFRKISKPKNSQNLPEKFVLYVGDINWNKNLPNLITACQKINFPLVIVGKQSQKLYELDLNHPELRHLKHVDWSKVIRLGFVDDEDLVNIYNLAAVYCQPSFAEGFGLPVLEAMACGTQVAVSKTHSLPEIVGEYGTYFDPHNSEEIAQALKTAMHSKYEVQQRAAQFSWEKTADATIDVYYK